jgi:Fic family protein
MLDEMYPPSYTFNERFVIESNMIDPQPGYNGNSPGDLMYDNHLSALELVLSNDWNLELTSPLDIHRVLTKGIPFFEDYGMSGKYRDVDCWIGNSICPKPFMIPNFMMQWYEKTMGLIEEGEKSPTEIAWISHHMFEVVHPFIDGNGRTGRLIFNKILTQLGQEPRIIFYDDRFQYYEAISDFRAEYFNGQGFMFCNGVLI